MKWLGVPAAALALAGALSACHDHGGTTAAANATTVDLRPAPDVSATQKVRLHGETPIAAAAQPVATSKQYMLVLGSVANDQH